MNPFPNPPDRSTRVLDALASSPTARTPPPPAPGRLLPELRAWPSPNTAEQTLAATDALAFRIVFRALAALTLVDVLQSDTQNVVKADGQTAHLWAILGGFAERLARPFVAGFCGATPGR
jgi:hypothetical protein